MSLTNAQDFTAMDLIVKFAAQTNKEQGLNHLFELKFGFANETSDETYLGLTESDFASRPYFRYAGAQRIILRPDIPNGWQLIL